MRIHIVQPDIVWESPQENHAKVTRLLNGICVDPGDVIVLPEMFSTGFSMDSARTIDVNNQTLEFLVGVARATQATVIGGRVVNAKTGGSSKARNVATVISGEGRVLAEYTKVHPFSPGKEHESYESGSGPVIVDISGFKVAPIVCYDLRFPELFRAGLLAGAEAFVVIACWPAIRHAHWRAMLLSRAIENQALVIGCNRCGKDPSHTYAGGSLAFGPTGNLLVEAGETEGVYSAKFDPQSVRAWREAFPAWKDHRLLNLSK